VFQHKTVEALATVVTFTTDEPTTHDDGQGTIPLTPVMLELRERGGLAGRFSQWMVVRVPADLGFAQLAEAVQAVVDQHGILRARLVRAAGHLEVGPPVDARDWIRRVDATGLDPDALAELIEHEARTASGSLDPDAGVVFGVVWLDRGPAGSGRLVLVAHHLVIDGVSWRVLLPDLATAHAAIAAGRRPELAPVTTSFRRYARALVEAATDPGSGAELEAWVRLLRAGGHRMFDRELDPRRDTEGSVRQLAVPLPADVTAELLTTVPTAFHAGVDDVLLAGLAAALALWRVPAPVLVDVEGHGRRELAPGLDLSRTVGWFTSVHPVLLDIGPADPADVLAGGPDAGRLVKHVKERIREVPGEGHGYESLRYLDDETGRVLAGLPRAEIGFNYLGRFSIDGAGTGEWQLAGPGAMGGDADPALPVRHALEIGGLVRDGAGEPELVLLVSWPEDLVPEAAVTELTRHWSDALRGVAAHAAGPDIGGHTPSDLPLVELTQGQIDAIEVMFDDVEAGG
jgi:nonribosomal peptide synthetase CepB